jgi:signal transduction histidine kinase/CheY-like chemotaxis protein
MTAATGIFHSALFRVARADGRLQWLQTRGRVEKDAAGRVVRIIGAFVDVTKLRTTEEALRQTQKLQALGTLAGGIAHDFNNLVLAIGGNAQLALGDVDPPHPAYASLQEIAKAAARASDLVRRILAFATREPLAPAVTPLQPAILDAVNLLSARMPSDASIETHFDDETAACVLGPAELGQVLTNLITNAIHALGTAPGVVRISVDPPSSDLPAELNPGTAYVCISIRDTGAGMDAETRARIFEPFFTTKPTGKGTGLGLAVVHGIVTAAGGALVVDSEVGRGSTFHVWLPRATQTVAAVAAGQAAPAAARGEHVLYVDDDESIGYLMRRTLERAGYRVTCCIDPRAAVQMFRNGDGRDVDVVVTDLAMPGMNGFDLVVALRGLHSDVPVLMTSGYTREDDQQRAAQLGIGRIILKPDTVEDLARELDRRCAELRARRDSAAPP